jgi:hemerythrin-like domain-containing protein
VQKLPADPLGELASCHERIDAHFAILEHLARQLKVRGCDPGARWAARTVLEFFDSAGELHHQDEDQDLFPLLRRLAARHGRREIAAAIDELEREHETMHSQWRRLRARLQAIVDGEGALDADEVARFIWLYRRHMEREGAAVLPFAREALDERQRSALGERMAARRVPPPSAPGELLYGVGGAQELGAEFALEEPRPDERR